MKTPKHPMIFNKQSTSAHPPRDPFHLPRASTALDYEGELSSDTKRHMVIAGLRIDL